MKNSIAIASIAAASVASMASAAVTVSNSYSDWTAAVATEAGANPYNIYVDELSNASGTGPVTGGAGWGVFSAAGTNGTIGTTGAGTGTNIVFAAGSNPPVPAVTFTFTYGNLGLRGVAFNFSATGLVGVYVNGNLAGFFAGTGLRQAGVTSSSAITSLTLAVSDGDTLTIGDNFYANIPAPGALALLGAAGMIGSRRRR